MARSELSDWLGLLGGGSKTTNLLLNQILKQLKEQSSEHEEIIRKQDTILTLIQGDPDLKALASKLNISHDALKTAIEQNKLKE